MRTSTASAWCMSIIASRRARKQSWPSALASKLPGTARHCHASREFGLAEITRNASLYAGSLSYASPTTESQVGDADEIGGGAESLRGGCGLLQQAIHRFDKGVAAAIQYVADDGVEVGGGNRNR